VGSQDIRRITVACERTLPSASLAEWLRGTPVESCLGRSLPRSPIPLCCPVLATMSRCDRPRGRLLQRARPPASRPDPPVL